MKPILAVFALLLLMFIGGCATKHKVSNAAFGKYISGFTSGKVNMDEEIKIELSQILLDSTKIDRKDTAFLKKSMSISPSVKGSFYWKNDKTIAFKPEDKFAEGKQYHVALKLHKFINVPSEFRTFDFFFETDEQQFEVKEYALSTYDNHNIEWQYYEMIASSNMELNKDSVKACFTAKQGQHSLPIRVASNSNRSYRIIVDSIKRGEQVSSIIVNWNNKILGGKISGDKTIKISPLGSYTVNRMEVVDDGDQKLQITFTDPILATQNFDGFITIQDAPKMQFSVTGNVVNIFLPERIEGTKKVTVNKGLLNFRNYKMDSTTSGVVAFNGARPALRMNGKGSILPNSQGLLFPFESIGIQSVDVRIIKIKEQNIHQFLQVNELDGYDGLTRVGKIVIEKTINLIADTSTQQNQWRTHILDLGKLIQPEPGNLYRVCIRFRKQYTYLPCRNENRDNNSEYIYETEQAKDKDWNEFGWHGEGFDGYNTWSNSGEDPCSDYYYRGGAISKNILASDIGVMYKEEANKTACIVTTNLLNALPLPNTEVTLYAYTQEKIASGVTDEKGMLQVSLSQKPFLLVAKKDKQRAYLKLTNANTLSVSKFDVQGEDQANGMKGFLYAERGVWRPGDSVFLNFVMNDQSNPLPDKHPIQFELNDPEGKLLFKRTVTESSGHIYSLYFKTSNNAQMGTYTAKVTVGNAVFYKNLLMEFIVPNRMKLLSNVDDKLLSSKDSVIYLKVNWLNGATGKELKTQASLSLKPDYNYFKKFEDYTFIAPYNESFRSSFELNEATTNDSGVATFKHPQMELQQAPGILLVDYVFKAYEQGGGFSNDKASSRLSVFDTYVGLKTPKGAEYSGSLDYSKQYAFPYVVLNKEQQKIDGHHLQLKIYEMQYQRWYEADKNDITSFRTHNAKICVRDTQWVDTKGEGLFQFGDIGKQYGRYMIVLKDLASGHETGALVIFDDPYWDRNSSDDVDFESIVQLSTNKKSYKVGEQVQVNVPCSVNANVLIHIESDAKVLQQFWVKGSATRQPISFTATKEMSPGMYIHATVLQPHNYTKDGSPIRQYGILPVKVEDPESRLTPLISMKDEVRPETNNNITISEQQGKEMYYSLVLVDEGLLDLTHFKTPDIWQHMNAQQSLKIKTWDMYNQVIGAFSGKIQNVFSIGGDGGYDETEATKANRFKPAIINLGVFHLAKGQKQQHNFNIPNYFGSMKAFVVAFESGKSGSVSKAFYVHKPIMLLTSAVRTMSAAEEYQIPVTVFNTEKKARKVKVSMKATGLSNFSFNQSQTITFNSDGDAVVNFKVKLPEETGVYNMEVTGADGNEKSTEKIELLVKPTQPIINHRQEQVIAPGASYTFDAASKGIKGTYSALLNISDLQHFDFEQRLRYLIQYPHGCVEQITSSAFAQLMLGDVQDVNDKDAIAIKENVESVLKRLSQYQTYNGGFSYWPYQYDINDYASVYVLHFMVKAQRKGFVVPQYMMDNAVNYQKEMARKYEPERSDNYREPELSQAYRLYLLAELNQSDLTAMNKFKESNIKNELSKALLAKAYKRLAKNDIASTMAKEIKWEPQKNNNTTYFASELRDQSMMLIALHELGNSITNQKMADNIAQTLNNDWNSTLATSMALVALSDYYSLSGAKGKRYNINGQSENLLKHSVRKALAIKNTDGKVVFKNLSNAPMYLALNEYYASTKQSEPLVNNGMKLKVTYLDSRNQVLNESRLPHGTNFTAKVEVTNTTASEMHNVALDFHIANGWQIISTRYVDDETLGKNSSADFTDVRDDSVNYFFRLSAKETKTYYISLNASYKGRFYLPLLQCYPMYNEKYKAQVGGKWVGVE